MSAPHSSPVSTRALCAVAGALALVAWLVYRDVLAYPHLGWDTWPLIAASHIESVSDFFGTFTEELMDGYYVDGNFYRPLVHFSFALNYAISGTDAWSYHAFDLGLLALNAGFLAALTARLFGSTSLAAPLVCGLFFLLHPAQMDVLPVSARRADGLFLLFTLLAVLCSLRSSTRASLIAGVCATFAVASKETGLIAAPLVFACASLFADGTWRQRLAAGARRSVPTVLGVVAFAIARTVVLGGLGGHASSASPELVASAFSFAHAYAGLVVVPQGDLFGIASEWVGTIVALLFGSQLILLARVRGGAQARAGCFLAIWMTLVFLISVASGRIEPWYTMAFIAVLAPAIGWLANVVVEERPRRLGLTSVMSVVILLAALVPSLVASLPLREQPEWPALASRTENYFERLSKRLEEAEETESIARKVPLSITYETETGRRTLSFLAVYTVRAWVAMTFGDSIVVRGRNEDAEGGGTAELVLEPTAVLQKL